MFGNRYICDCCGKKGLKENQVKEVCEDCFKEVFESKIPLDIQVKKKMDKETMDLLEKNKEQKPLTIDEAEYVDWSKI